MATRLADFATAVHAVLTAAGITDVEQVNDRESLQKHQAKRRIAWLTEGGTIEPPDQAGARVSSSNANQRVVACKIRVESVDAYIFGGTREATEELLDAVIAAAFQVGGARLQMPRYRWATQEEPRAGSTLRTQLCVLTMNLRLPVNAEISALTSITGIEDVCGTLDEDGNVIPQG